MLEENSAVLAHSSLQVPHQVDHLVAMVEKAWEPPPEKNLSDVPTSEASQQETLVASSVDPSSLEPESRSESSPKRVHSTQSRHPASQRNVPNVTVPYVAPRPVTKPIASARY